MLRFILTLTLCSMTACMVDPMLTCGNTCGGATDGQQPSNNNNQPAGGNTGGNTNDPPPQNDSGTPPTSTKPDASMTTTTVDASTADASLADAAPATDASGDASTDGAMCRPDNAPCSSGIDCCSGACSYNDASQKVCTWD